LLSSRFPEFGVWAIFSLRITQRIVADKRIPGFPLISLRIPWNSIDFWTLLLVGFGSQRLSGPVVYRFPTILGNSCHGFAKESPESAEIRKPGKPTKTYQNLPKYTFQFELFIISHA
jgi:hypothetical protein